MYYRVTASAGKKAATVWITHAEGIIAKASIPSGARWITVHPNGSAEKGVPVLIQETAPGSGVHRVIGGAGGKLNYLKLKGVKSPEQYRDEVASQRKEKAKARREERKKQREADKAAGVDKAKNSATADIDAQVAAKRSEVLRKVAGAMGWDGAEFDASKFEELSPAAQKKAFKDHEREWMNKARDAIDKNRKRLLLDHEARTDALGDSLAAQSSDTETVAFSDLAPEPDGAPGGLGYAPNFKRDSGDGSSVEAEVASIKAQQPEDTRKTTEKAAATREAIQSELQSAREESGGSGAEDAEIQLVAAEKAAELIRAEKELRMLERKAQKAKAKIDKSIEAPGPVLLQIDPFEVDDALQAEAENSLRTLSTVAFLDKVKGAGAETARYLGVGAYNAINTLTHVAAGGSLIDRRAVDVLGVGATAAVLARRLTNDLGQAETARIKDALEAFHKDTYQQATDKAVAKAMRWQDVAGNMEVTAAESGEDLALMQEVTAQRRAATNKARAILGQTLGEMEANAAMIFALGQRPKDSVQLAMGDMSAESAVRRLRALGLQAGDYEITSAGATRFALINASGMDRLAEPIDAVAQAQTRRAIAIQSGAEDEEGWLPAGMANRPDLEAKPAPGVAQRLAEPFRPGADMAQAVADYIGGRAADGDAARDIVADLRSETMALKAGERRGEFWSAVDSATKRAGADGKRVNADDLTGEFQALADDYVQRRFGVERTALHKQNIPVNDTAVEALHRALSAHPDGIAAFKPAGDLDAKEQGALRDYWWQHVGQHDDTADEAREKLSHMSEPQKTTVDMFGEETESPEWRSWKSERDALTEEINAAGLSWPKYAKIMGGPVKAYAAVQDMIKGEVSGAFAEAYNTLAPNSPLKIGRAMISGHLNHVDATDPATRAERLSAHQDLVDRLRERNKGRYAQGSVSGKLEAQAAEDEAAKQSQMGLFGEEEQAEDQATKPLEPGMRQTLGVAAERTLAGMVPHVGQNFRSGRPVKLWQSSMDGRYINGQRAIKMLDNSKRLLLSQGTGSGKTKMGLAAFAHLHEGGKAKKGIYAVPSVVQGQFGGEALRYLEPGKFKWHAEPGASRESRVAAYKDPETHFSVVTHQALRDDLIHLGAEQAGTTTAKLASKVLAMSVPERKAWMGDLLAKEGINPDFLMVDEGHDLLGRAGKKDSLMAAVIDSVAHNSTYYVSSSADPVKNDPSEIFSALQKLDPDKYSDSAEFKRKYGVDTPASQDALRREMARYHYPGSIDPGVDVTRDTRTVSMTTSQKDAMKGVERAAASARLARIRGSVDVDALKQLSPSSFKNADEAQHDHIAARLTQNLGIIKDAAVRRVMNEHKDGAKLQEISFLASERKGKPGVVFAHSRAAVAAIKAELEAKGHRVVALTGSDSAKEKDAKRRAFHPEQGDATADILVASDAGATGLNLQRGQWLAQYDTPMTAKTHAQRNGRINRLGQKNSIELIDLVGDHPSERKARKRLQEKSELRQILTSPLDGLDDTGLAGYLNQSRTNREQASLF